MSLVLMRSEDKPLACGIFSIYSGFVLNNAKMLEPWLYVLLGNASAPRHRRVSKRGGFY